jgi:hypothetical protein
VLEGFGGDLLPASPCPGAEAVGMPILPADRGLNELARSERAQQAGLNRGELGRRFHRIKSRGRSSGPRDSNRIDTDTGDVYDTEPDGSLGEYIGNVFNDF